MTYKYFEVRRQQSSRKLLIRRIFTPTFHVVRLKIPSGNSSVRLFFSVSMCIIIVNFSLCSDHRCRLGVKISYCQQIKNRVRATGRHCRQMRRKNIFGTKKLYLAKTSGEKKFSQRIGTIWAVLCHLIAN